MTDTVTAYIESADLAHYARTGLETEQAPLDLDKLPAGVVSGNTLIDFQNAGDAAVTKSGVALAMQFAARNATAQAVPDEDEDAWLARYTSNLGRLGFAVGGTAVNVARFKKKGLFVHEAIIPFLTIALGGVAVGPIIIQALKSLQSMGEGRPWITLFDRESRHMNTREMHFAAVSTDTVATTIRLVVARLDFVAEETNVLFFRIQKTNAEFESASTSMTIDNGQLAFIEGKLRVRLEADAGDFIDTGVI